MNIRALRATATLLVMFFRRLRPFLARPEKLRVLGDCSWPRADFRHDSVWKVLQRPANDGRSWTMTRGKLVDHPYLSVDGQRLAFRRHGQPTSRGLVQSQKLVVPLRAITQSGSLNWVVGATGPHPKEALQLPEAVVSRTEMM